MNEMKLDYICLELCKFVASWITANPGRSLPYAVLSGFFTKNEANGIITMELIEYMLSYP
jgi:hypothetical protein